MHKCLLNGAKRKGAFRISLRRHFAAGAFGEKRFIYLSYAGKYFRDEATVTGRDRRKNAEILLSVREDV